MSRPIIRYHPAVPDDILEIVKFLVNRKAVPLQIAFLKLSAGRFVKWLGVR